MNGTFVEIDAKAGRVHEYTPPTPYSPFTDFYAGTADKNGEFWAGEIHGRGFLRFNPKGPGSNTSCRSLTRTRGKCGSIIRPRRSQFGIRITAWARTCAFSRWSSGRLKPPRMPGRPKTRVLGVPVGSCQALGWNIQAPCFDSGIRLTAFRQSQYHPPAHTRPFIFDDYTRIAADIREES